MRGIIVFQQFWLEFILERTNLETVPAMKGNVTIILIKITHICIYTPLSPDVISGAVVKTIYLQGRARQFLWSGQTLTFSPPMAIWCNGSWCPDPDVRMEGWKVIRVWVWSVTKSIIRRSYEIVVRPVDEAGRGPARMISQHLTMSQVYTDQRSGPLSGIRLRYLLLFGTMKSSSS